VTSAKEIASEPHTRSVLEAGKELLLLINGSSKELKRRKK